MFFRQSLAVVLLTLFASLAQAGFVFTPSITYMTQDVDDGTTPQDVKLTLIDMRLGYIMDFGLYVGGMYSIQDQDIFSNDSSDAFFGPSVGYYNSGFFAVATLFIHGEKDFSQGNTKLTNVSGFQVDLSYLTPITDGVFLGPQLTYQSVEFAEAEVAGVSSSTNFSFTSVSPYFSLLFMF